MNNSSTNEWAIKIQALAQILNRFAPQMSIAEVMWIQEFIKELEGLHGDSGQPTADVLQS